MSNDQKIILLTTHEYASPDKPLLNQLIQEGFNLLFIAGSNARSWEVMIDAMMIHQQAAEHPIKQPFVASFSQAPLYQLVDMAINFPDKGNHEVRMIRV